MDALERTMGERRTPGVLNENLAVSCTIPPDDLTNRVREIASEISADYCGEEVVVVGVLNGAWVFMADLVPDQATCWPVSAGFGRCGTP